MTVVQANKAQLSGCEDAIPIPKDRHNKRNPDTKEEGRESIVTVTQKSPASPEGGSQDEMTGNTRINNHGKAVNVGAIKIDGGQTNTII
ncbi:hypothetical protein F5Y10DRAFT_85961 [Nemania abortiva]|nr:hypothetical protein F5Y10DRAFT_85961 [Nemania abortiva]